MGLFDFIGVQFQIVGNNITINFKGKQAKFKLKNLVLWFGIALLIFAGGILAEPFQVPVAILAIIIMLFAYIVLGERHGRLEKF